MKCSQESIDHTLKIAVLSCLWITRILVAKIAGMLTFIETLTCILSLPSKPLFYKRISHCSGLNKGTFIWKWKELSSKKRYFLMGQARILLSLVSRAPRVLLPQHFYSVCKLKRGVKAHSRFRRLSLCHTALLLTIQVALPWGLARIVRFIDTKRCHQV